jgi:queuine tRNA-ribosyltransferase
LDLADHFLSHPNRKLGKMTEEGALFHSSIDGTKHGLTPQVSIQVQWKLGAHIISTFDEWTPFDVGRKYIPFSMDRSHRWELHIVAELKK